MTHGVYSVCVALGHSEPPILLAYLFAVCVYVQYALCTGVFGRQRTMAAGLFSLATLSSEATVYFRRQARPKYTHDGVYRFPIKGYARRRRRVMTVVRNIARTTMMAVICGQVSANLKTVNPILLLLYNCIAAKSTQYIGKYQVILLGG